MGCSQSQIAASVDFEAPSLRNKKDFLLDYASEQGPFYTCDGTTELKIMTAKVGPAGSDTPPVTVVELFRECLKKNADKPAFRVERPLPEVANKIAPPSLPLDQWKQWTYQQYFDEVNLVAKALISVGFDQFDSCNVFGFNSPEWVMSQQAAIFAGGRVAGIYPTDTPEQVAYKCAHSGGSVMVLEDVQKLKKLSTIIDSVPKLKAIVVWTPSAELEKTLTRSDGSTIAVYSWADFVEKGKEVTDETLAARQAKIKASHCCGLIYTSGTTGNPKAVMISHDNIVYCASAVFGCVPALGSGGEERILSYLPLSHVAGMMTDIIGPMLLTARTQGYQCVYFARPYDLKVMSFGDRLRAVKPTIFLGVPRVWEKVAEKMKAIGAQTKGIKKKIATWAKSKGLEHQKECQIGGTGAYPSNYARADKLVLSKVKTALGLEQCKFGLTGAAPISKDTLEYFGSLGIQINELYGMSECTGATTISTDEAHLWGSCGWAVPGTEVKCFKVNPDDINEKKECDLVNDVFNASESAQGEICFRGRHIMMGYLANPDLGPEHVKEIQDKTAGAIDAEGWLHSGDKGCISTQGMVKITGRYKELIIGSGGENIAPVPIENSVKKIAGGISNIMMVGDKRKFNVALVTLKAEGATGENPGTDNLLGDALAVNSAVTTISAASKDEAWKAYITEAITQVNKGLNPPSRIQRFSILPADFSVETEELTPTLKLKRSVVSKKWNALIESMYAPDVPTGTCYIECKV